MELTVHPGDRVLSRSTIGLVWTVNKKKRWIMDNSVDFILLVTTTVETKYLACIVPGFFVSSPSFDMTLSFLC